MIFVYLSTTKELVFKTKESTIQFFKDFLKGNRKKFPISSGKIDRNKFNIGEDIFFL
ncbi:hypothetical protein [Abyssisolibacter fermentans]|uniref:hypothetical protein n=1 Tax=Abyssisolibacter fermentans TaxID=1766203 RepID=UPI0012E3B3CC|nr:hypothetical protein [Abyssisolibacter fermentans]